MEDLSNNRLLMAFYGDDFTGSTDALESLTNVGIKTVLFIDCPGPQQLSRYNNLQAIGIAGISRSLSPLAMNEILEPTFKAILSLNPKHVHYKICSTFDSSPTIGSIGRAIDIAAEVFKTTVVPLLVAAPILGRYCLFGNLFARMGIGSDGAIFRLDRHPSMSNHPTTPADESDLRLHLAKQTNKKIGLFNILELQNYRENNVEPDFSAYEIVLFDALKQEDLTTIGQLIDLQSKSNNIVFSVGSSGIAMALGAYWKEKKLIIKKQEFINAPAGGPILVVSGSCSAVTSAQINFALKAGFAEIAIDTASLAGEAEIIDFEQDSALMDKTARQYADLGCEFIKQGKSLIIHTSLGNPDERIAATDRIFKQKNFDRETTARLYGNLLGAIVRYIAEATNVQRIVIAGGDTSSYAARAMGIEAVEMMAPLSPGAPICLVHAASSPLDKLQVVFKGGQVGKPDFFVNAQQDIHSDS